MQINNHTQIKFNSNFCFYNQYYPSKVIMAWIKKKIDFYMYYSCIYVITQIVTEVYLFK